MFCMQTPPHKQGWLTLLCKTDSSSTTWRGKRFWFELGSHSIRYFETPPLAALQENDSRDRAISQIVRPSSLTRNSESKQAQLSSDTEFATPDTLDQLELHKQKTEDFVAEQKKVRYIWGIAVKSKLVYINANASLFQKQILDSIAAEEPQQRVGEGVTR